MKTAIMHVIGFPQASIQEDSSDFFESELTGAVFWSSKAGGSGGIISSPFPSTSTVTAYPEDVLFSLHETFASFVKLPSLRAMQYMSNVAFSPFAR